MSAPSVEDAVRSPASRSLFVPAGSRRAATAVVLIGAAFLVARPALVPLRPAVPLLAAGYVGLWGLSLRGPATRSRTAPLPAALVLAVGVGAFGAAAALSGPAASLRGGAVALGLNTLAALAEEAFFRRLLYARLEPHGVVLAIVGSALAFALVHVPSYGTAAFPVDLGAGLLLSWQRWASGRWTVPAATHAAANLLAVIR
jgi:membrane protease YdiL (CAAX protease family)